MASDERQYFGARTDSLPSVCEFVERRCEVLHIPRTTALRLRLIAEELFINAVDYGYGGDCDARVALTVRENGREIELIEEDEGGAFNPFADLRNPSESDDPEERPVGGLGRILVVGMTVRQHYERRGNANRVMVVLRKTPTEGETGAPVDAGSSGP